MNKIRSQHEAIVPTSNWAENQIIQLVQQSHNG